MNKYLFDMYMETLSDELPPEVAAKRWPFAPRLRVNCLHSNLFLNLFEICLLPLDGIILSLY